MVNLPAFLDEVEEAVRAFFPEEPDGVAESLAGQLAENLDAKGIVSFEDWAR